MSSGHLKTCPTCTLECEPQWELASLPHFSNQPTTCPYPVKTWSVTPEFLLLTPPPLQSPASPVILVTKYTSTLLGRAQHQTPCAHSPREREVSLAEVTQVRHMGLTQVARGWPRKRDSRFSCGLNFEGSDLGVTLANGHTCQRGTGEKGGMWARLCSHRSPGSWWVTGKDLRTGHDAAITGPHRAISKRDSFSCCAYYTHGVRFPQPDCSGILQEVSLSRPRQSK